MKKKNKFLILLPILLLISIIFSSEKTINIVTYNKIKKSYRLENNIIKNININTSKTDFLNKFEIINDEFNITCPLNSNYIGTLCELKSKNDGTKRNYYTLVLGDTSGDGKASIIDMVQIVDNASKQKPFTSDILKEASDIDLNDKYEKKDALDLSNYEMNDKTIPFKKPGKGIVTISTDNIYLSQGESKTIKANLKTNDVVIKSATSTNTDVATVDNVGKITAISNGETVINLKFSNDEVFNINVNVITKPTGIIIAGDKNVNLSYIGKTINLTAEVSPKTASNKAFIWSSSNPDIVDITKDGKVTSKSVGTARITATSSVDSKISDYIDITVDNKLVATINDTNYKDYKIVKSGSNVSYKLKSDTGFNIKSIDNMELYVQDPVSYEMKKSNDVVSFDENTQKFSFTSSKDMNDIGLIKFRLLGITDEKGNKFDKELSGYQLNFSLNLNSSGTSISSAVGVDNSFYVKDYTFSIKESSESSFTNKMNKSTTNAYVFNNLKPGKKYTVKVDINAYKDRLVRKIENNKLVGALSSTISKSSSVDGLNDDIINGSIEETIEIKNNNNKNLEVYSLNVSNGKDENTVLTADSTFIRYNGKNILIDAGRDLTHRNVDGFKIVNAVKAITKNEHPVIDYLIISHNHIDHIGGSKYIFDNLGIRNYVISAAQYQNYEDYEMFKLNMDKTYEKENFYNYVIKRTDYFKNDYARYKKFKNESYTPILNDSINPNLIIATAGNVLNVDGLILNTFGPYTSVETPYEWFQSDCFILDDMKKHYYHEYYTGFNTPNGHYKGSDDTLTEKMYKLTKKFPCGACHSDSRYAYRKPLKNYDDFGSEYAASPKEYYIYSYNQYEKNKCDNVLNGKFPEGTPVEEIQRLTNTCMYAKKYRDSAKYLKETLKLKPEENPKHLEVYINMKRKNDFESGNVHETTSYSSSSVSNSFSIISKLMLGNKSMLFTGDGEFFEEEMLLGYPNEFTIYQSNNGVYEAPKRDFKIYEDDYFNDNSKFKYTKNKISTSLKTDLESKKKDLINELNIKKSLEAKTTLSETEKIQLENLNKIHIEDHLKKIDKFKKISRITAKDIKSDILKRGHHEYNNSTSIDFLNKVKPEKVLVSGADVNRVYASKSGLKYLGTFEEYNLIKYFSPQINTKYDLLKNYVISPVTSNTYLYYDSSNINLSGLRKLSDDKIEYTLFCEINGKETSDKALISNLKRDDYEEKCNYKPSSSVLSDKINNYVRRVIKFETDGNTDWKITK